MSYEMIPMDTDYLQKAEIHLTIRRVAILCLVAVFCIYGLQLPVGPVNIRPEKLLALAALPIGLSRLILKGKLLTVNKTHLLLTLWIVQGLVVSLLSIDPTPMVKHWLDITLSVAFFYLIYAYRPREVFMNRPGYLLWIGAVLGFCGGLVAFLYRLGVAVEGTILSTFAYTEYGSLRIKMTLWEANIFGIVMAVFCLMSVVDRRSKNLADWLVIFLCHAGLLVSYSRGPIVAYGIGLIVYYLLIGRKALSRILMCVFVAALIMAMYSTALIWLGVGEESGLLRYYSLKSRYQVLVSAFDSIKSRPLLGSGIYSAESLYPDLPQQLGAEEGTKGWIGVLPVAILHDTGAVGFVLFYGFFLIIFRRGYRAVIFSRMQAVDSAVMRRMAACLSAGVMLHVASLATSLYSMALFWSVMALVANLPFVARTCISAESKGCTHLSGSCNSG